ncbi:ring finger domain containing [Cryptosporidium sp. chipmunk genotype I]|uniref:ring finger domain containing n=1 Tax=Cryptosporidium sp. chipmunk genotype I TaxID=1280935 RepID=UPI00351A6490|nr:ring finger domain containing [Cryptosporidium sp. chipmunk genotype I]
MNDNDNILLDNEYINRISKNSIKKVLKKTNINHPNTHPGLVGLLNNSTNCNSSISCSASSSSSSSISNYNITDNTKTFCEGEFRGRSKEVNSKNNKIITVNSYSGVHSNESSQSREFFEVVNRQNSLEMAVDNSYLKAELREDFDDKDNNASKKLIKKEESDKVNSQEVKKLRIPDCSICREYLTRNLTVITVCGHVFHKQCIDAWLSKCDSNKNSNLAQGRLNYLLTDNGEPTCPLCRVPCSVFTLCDLVNITIDETLVLEDSEEKFQCSQKEEVVNSKNSGECIQINCRLKLKTLADESEAKKKEVEELRAQLCDEKTKVLIKTDLTESLERKNEVLREDLNRITHELGEMNQKYSDLHRKYTFLQSNNAINNFMGERLEDDLTIHNQMKDGQTIIEVLEDETNQISNLIGFNPFEGEDSLEKREDAFQALKILSNAFIKLSGRYDQIKEKSSKWRAKCYQLKDLHTTSINECNFLKEKLRNLNKALNTSEAVKKPNWSGSSSSNIANPTIILSDVENDEESFSYISKLIQDKKAAKPFSESIPKSQTNQENKAKSSSSTPSNLKINTTQLSSRNSHRIEFENMSTEGKSGLNIITGRAFESKGQDSRDEESPNPNYSNLIKSRRNQVMKRNIPRDSQSISSFFYTRKPKLKFFD